MKSSILPIAILLLASVTSANLFNDENSGGLRGQGRKHTEGDNVKQGQKQAKKEKQQQQQEEGRSAPDNLDSRIIGGSEAKEKKYKFAASLQDNLGHFCGGSLIARDVVLTAAHCQGAPFDVVLGRHDLDSKNGQKIGITRQLPHPKYNSQKTDMDFMLVFLKSAATLNGDVDTVKLNDDSSAPKVGTGVTVMGWGDTDIRDDVSKLSDVLMEVQVNTISNGDCDDSKGNVGGYSDNYNGQITQNMMCAKANKQDSCQGDSGGPLVTNDGVQVGVVSWGVSCAHSSFPGVYARVSRAVGWIEDEVCNRSDFAKEAGFNCSGNNGSGGNNNPSPSPPSGNGGNNKPPTSGGGGGGGGNCSKHNKWDCKRESSCRWKKGKCLAKK